MERSGLCRRVRGGVRTSDEGVLRSDEDDGPAAPLVEEDAERLTRGEEVAACQDRVVLLPVSKRRLGDGRARGETGRGDEDVDPAVLEYRTPRHLYDCVLARDIDEDGKSAAKAVRGRQLLRDLLDALDVAIGDNDVRAAGSKHACGRAADAARTAGDQRDAARELPPWRCLRKLVSLERPVLDRERLAL